VVALAAGVRLSRVRVGRERRWINVAQIEYYLSTCPRVGLTRAAPAGLFRCVRDSAWLSAQYLDAGRWRSAATLVYEITSGLGPLERIGFEEAMALLRSRGGRPDSIDERARAGDASSVEVAASELLSGA
jgi:hypothetical protein